MRKSNIYVVILLCFAMLTSLLPNAAIAAEPPAPPILLKAGILQPGADGLPELPPGLTIRDYAVGQNGYYIVQFDGPIETAWQDSLQAAGAELVDYLPDFAYKVRMNPAQAAQVAQLGSVTGVSIFQPAYKLSPDLEREGTNVYRVRIERGADAGLATAAIMQSGAEVLKREQNYLLVAADWSQVEAVARVLDVAWIQNFNLPEKHNEYGAGVILNANTVNAAGYDGSTQTIAVADTGLGDGTVNGAHPGLLGHVSAIYNWTTRNARLCYRVKGDGPQDVDSGHGTHVAVSTAGSGGPGGVGRGTAPAANLVFQAVEDYLDIYAFCDDGLTPDGYYLIGLPEDLGDIYQEAYNAGARIHANSWGSNAQGAYTIDSANTDAFIYNNRDMVITFSAGNAGTDRLGGTNGGDGEVDADSIGSPATAKNVITVGASENDRQGDYPCDTSLTYLSHDAYQPNTTCSGMNGQNILGTYGGRWSNDFQEDPIATDPTAGNAEQMAAFSSRGPTDDQRIKPDIVAPGTWVLSGYSSLHQEGYGDGVNTQNNLYQVDGWGMPASVEYKYFGGTSMSNPLAAGAAAVVRDYYQKAFGHNASAALVKATLINSAVDLLDENNDGSDDNDYPIPNIHEGWGRIDLSAAVADNRQFVDEAVGLSTGGAAIYQFDIESATIPFKVSLVWSDAPSSEAAATNLVNDLDLVVTDPSGQQVYAGNDFSGGWTQTGGSADRVNNVENVYIASPAVGTWTVEVKGYNVPMGPQPFALVVLADTGDQPTPDTPPSVTIIEPTENATVAGSTPIRVAASDAEDDDASLTVEWNIDDGAWQGTTFDGTTYTASWDTTNVADGIHTVNARAIDSANNTTLDSVQVTVSNNSSPATTIHVGDLDGYATAGRRGRWDATVVLTVEDSNEAPVAAATVSASWSGIAKGGGSCTTDTNGQCEITKSNLRDGSATLSVDDVSAIGYTYASGDNHDPDGDSSGTSITLDSSSPAPASVQTAATTESNDALYIPFLMGE